MNFGLVRRNVALQLCLIICFSLAQGQSTGPVPPDSQPPVLWRPYVPPKVPPIGLDNSSRMSGLFRSGNLYLTAQDAIALVLENNIDIEVERYNPIEAAWAVQRAEAGQLEPFLSTAPSLVGAVAPGQGISGSETAAGAGTPAAGTAVSRSPNATLSTIGPVPQNLDPIFSEATVFSHASQPQSNTVLSLTSALLSTAHTYTGTLQEGFLSGGSAAVTYSDHYLRENASTDFLNPSVAPSLSVSFQHSLLRGFGVALNARNIIIAKINVRVSDLAFKLQVTNAVIQTLSLYDTLVACYADTRDKQSALELAQELYEEDKKQVEAGSLVQLDVTSAASALAAAQRDLLISQGDLQQQELQLKSLLSRTGSADPWLKNAHIIPLDELSPPENEDLPRLQTLIQQAMASRADLAIERAEIKAAELSALGTENGILPTLQVLGGATDAGLAGTQKSAVIGKATETMQTSFLGGIGRALGDVLRRDYPAERLGAALQIPIFNRLAQADFGFDQLSIRQIQLINEKDISQVQVDLLNSLAKLQQARARYDTAVKYRLLAKQLLDSAREAYSVGKSTSFEVMQAQRELSAGQYAELLGMVSWRFAQIRLDMTLGTTLETNHISIPDAMLGNGSRSPMPR